jgi:all-trans-8'-apo-beta-carotenal 15,15'-oxygenase
MPNLLNRRRLLQVAAGSGACALAAPYALASPDGPTLWLRDGVEKDLPRLTVEGRFPADLRGVFYRNGPAGHSVEDLRYRHWFDGDGMAQAWRVIDPDHIAYRSRYVRTHKRTAEQAAGRPLVPAFATVPPGVRPLTAPARLNPANINILPVGGRVLALWETGPAWEIDPVGLDTLGEVDWRKDLQGLAFSAHPKIEPDGDVWNFGVNYPGGEMMIWRIGANGALKRFTMLKTRHPGMLHDVATTEKSLVFVLTPYFLSAERLTAGRSFLDSHDWRPDLPTRVLAVDKDDPDKVRVWELPAGFGFHFSNAWEEADGTIRFDFTLADDPGVVARRLAGVMDGRWETAAPLRLTSFVLRPGGRVETAPLSAGESEFPRVDPRIVGRRHSAVFHLEKNGAAPWFNTVVRRDDGAPTAAYRYPDGVAPEEHLFVPRPDSSGGEGFGWVLGTVIDAARDRHGLAVFDASRLSDGPMATAWMDGAQPPGLHAAFVPAG